MKLREQMVAEVLHDAALAVRAAGCDTLTDLLIVTTLAKERETLGVGVSVSSIARSLKLPISTASRVIWELCQTGLVELTRTKLDRRVKLAKLTRKGVELTSRF